ncbi:MAG TPA: phosphoglycerate kinase [Actinomycetota bacterium]|nr:phosphoglycerate kinase [Actinomycetota bacterium]
MGLRTLDDLGDVAGRTVFVRVDFNVPLEDGAVADDARIRAALPTIRELIGRGAELVLASHLGRPKGQPKDELRLGPVADRLSDLVGVRVAALGLPGEPGTAEGIDDLEPGEIVLLENLRFDAREEANDPAFAGALADHVDAYVDDAFGAAHRAHASVRALPELLIASGRPAVAGRLMQREVEVLGRLRDAPERPYVAILGGAKVSDKLAVIDALIDRVDALLVGGAMAFTLLAADGARVGRSLVEDERFDDVRAAQAKAKDKGVLIELPSDVVAAGEMSADVPMQTVNAREIPNDLMGLDIGPRTVEEFARILADAKTILWNGPMGVFELEPFSAGTRGVATAAAGANAFTVVGGGDSLLAIKRAGLEEGFDHLSTGGGASLEFLEGRELPGISILEDRP